MTYKVFALAFIKSNSLSLALLASSENLQLRKGGSSLFKSSWATYHLSRDKMITQKRYSHDPKHFRDDASPERLRDRWGSLTFGISKDQAYRKTENEEKELLSYLEQITTSKRLFGLCSASCLAPPQWHSLDIIVATFHDGFARERDFACKLILQ